MYHHHGSFKVHLRAPTYGYPTALRFRGSILPRVWLPVLLMTLWATVVYLLNIYVCNNGKFCVVFPSIFLTITSLVMSLLLAFRTNTAYERFWEGIDEPELKDQIEKQAAIKLILAYFIAIKNFLRGDYGLCDQSGNTRPEFNTLIPLQKRRQINQLSHGTNVDEITPLGELISSQDNLPIDISHLLSAYFISHIKKKTIDIPQFTAMINAMNNMVDIFTSLDRILTTPIPKAYNIHLKQVVYIYLIMLPLQVVTDSKYLVILICFVTAFTFIGVESIGSEIENPFGIDPNDLPLELYIEDLRRELYELMQKPRVELTDWELDAVRLPASGFIESNTPDHDLGMNIPITLPLET